MSLSQLNEHEQAELIKGWWKKYGSYLLTVVALIALAISGTQFWHRHQRQEIQLQSIAYEGLMNAIVANKPEMISAQANGIINSYPKSTYAVLASLELAKVAVNENDLPAAQKNLAYAVVHASTSGIKSLATVREARVWVGLKNPAKALALLGKPAKGFGGMYADVRGDAYAFQGKTAQAKAAYHNAEKLLQPGSPLLGVVMLKLTQLPVNAGAEIKNRMSS
jgi:predicted negative regulator of RcsB-dependent stress response